jgi:hypothetical protein
MILSIITLSILMLSIVSLSKMTNIKIFSIMTFSITALSIATFNITAFSISVSKCDTQHNVIKHPYNQRDNNKCNITISVQIIIKLEAYVMLVVTYTE